MFFIIYIYIHVKYCFLTNLKDKVLNFKYNGIKYKTRKRLMGKVE